MKLTTTLIFFLTFLFQSSFCQTKLIFADNNFTFKLITDSTYDNEQKEYSCFVKKIIIVSKKSNQLIQTITPPENGFFCESSSIILKIQDVNFDGKNDFLLRQFPSGSPNVPYYFWVYNGKTNKFYRDSSLEEITSPRFDSARKEILSFWRGSASDHGWSTYKYINGKITLVEEVETFTDSNDRRKIITITKKRIKGKMKLVDKEVEIDKSIKDEKEE